MSSTATQHTQATGTILKYASLLVLVVQNSALAILLRWAGAGAGSHAPGEDGVPPPSAAVAVLAAEWMKGAVAMLALATLHQGAGFRPARPPEASRFTGLAYPPHLEQQQQQRPWSRHKASDAQILSLLSLLRTLADQCFGPGSHWHLCVPPALLYLVQNNLQYRAASLLDPATFQVTYQLKLLTTALFSVLLLGRRVTVGKWACLLLLTTGVALVQLPEGGRATDFSDPTSPANSGWRQFDGLLTVLLACILSGLAGVWFERVLKSKSNPTPVTTGSSTRSGSKGSNPNSDAMSLWVRTIQLCALSIVLGTVTTIWMEGQKLYALGVFHGFTRWTWYAILCQALGGLVVALVVKYADNIMKGFATSLSILLSTLLSVCLFGTRIHPTFVTGAGMVMVSALAYLYLDLRVSRGPRTPLLPGAGGRGRGGRGSGRPSLPSPPAFMVGYLKSKW